MTRPQPVAALIAARRIEQVPADGPSAREFQRMRRRRNKSEYDDIIIGQADLAADLAHAEAIIEAVRNAL